MSLFALEEAVSDATHSRATRGRPGLRRLRAAADRGWPAAAGHDRPADGRERVPGPGEAVRGPHRRDLRPARPGPEQAQGRRGHERAGDPGRGRPRDHRGARRRPGGDARQQRRRGDRARVGHGVPGRRVDPGRARAADRLCAAGRGGRPAGPGGLHPGVPGQGLGRRNGRVHRDDLVGGRGHG